MRWRKCLKRSKRSCFGEKRGKESKERMEADEYLYRRNLGEQK